MGKRPVTERLPEGVQCWTDRATGRTYCYTRIAGVKRTRLPGLPWSDEFMTALTAARETKGGKPAPRVKAGSFSFACVAYYNSEEFKALGASTQEVYRNIAEKFREESADKSAATFTKADVKRWLRNRSANAAYNFLKVLRGIVRAAIENGLRDDDPTEGLKARPKDGEGFLTWSRAAIAQYEARHPIGTKARLAMSLLLFTGVRRSDVVQLGRQFERMIDGREVLQFKPQKTRRKKPKRELTLPILPDLREAIDACPSGHLTYLVTEFGKPFAAAGFGNKFAEWCEEAGLPAVLGDDGKLRNYRAHGLRKGGATIAAERGATLNQLMAIYGWETAKEAVHYTKQADRTRLAVAAMPALLGNIQEQVLSKPETGLSKQEGNRRKTGG